MASSSQGGSARRPRSWRQAGKTTSKSSSTRLGRWFLTLLTAALCVLFVVWLFWRNKPLKTLVVAVSIPQTDRYVASEIAYAREDISAMGLALQSIDGCQLIEKPQTTTENTLRELAGEIERGTPDKTDVLITYLIAHGISNQGDGYLLCSDFYRGSIGPGGRGTYPVGQLLREFARKENRVSLKLVILDCGRLATAPPLGMVINEFPRIIEQQLRGLPEEQFWVLLPNTTFQSSSVDHARRRSVFGMSIVEALQGAADGSMEESTPDEFVTLAEFYTYVWQRCAQLADEIGVVPQTPLLMKAGKGLIGPEELSGQEYDEAIYRLVSVNRPVDTGLEDQPATGQARLSRDGTVSAAADAFKGAMNHVRIPIGESTLGLAAPSPSEETASPSEKDTSSAPPKDAGAPPSKPSEAASASGDSKSAGAEKGANASAAAAVQPSSDGGDANWPSDLQTLYRAWTLRDQIQSLHDDGMTWSPVDFAPHFWRQLSAELLSHESRLLSQSRGPTIASATTAASESQRTEPPPEPESQRLEDPGLIAADLLRLKLALSSAASTDSERATSVVSDDGFQTDIGKRLWQAWIRFSGDESMASFVRADSSPQLKAVSQAIRDYHDAVFLVPSFIQYELVAGPSAPRELPTLPLIDDLIAFRNHLSSVEDSPLDPADPWFGRLGDLRDSINRKRESCARIMDEMADTVLKPPSSSPIRVQHEIDALLATAVLSANRRARLMNELLSASSDVKRPLARNHRRHSDALPPVLTGSRENWTWLLARTKELTKIVQHADAETVSQFEPALSRIEVLTGQSRIGQDEDELWKEYRGVGAHLGDFYSHLAERVDRLATAKSGDASAGHDLLADQLLRAIIPRDVQTRSAWRVAGLHVALRRPEDFVRFRSDGRSVQLVESEGTIEVVVEASKRELLGYPVKLEYDPRLLNVEQLPGEISSGPDGVFRKALNLRVRALQDQELAKRADVPIKLQLAWLDGDERKSAEQEIQCGLPFPNRVDVVVESKALVQLVDRGEGVIELKVPPNRPTELSLALVNHSGRDREVSVALHAVPPSREMPPGRIAPRTRQLLAEEGGVGNNAGFTQLAETKLTLPGEGRRTVDFGASSGADSKDSPGGPADKSGGAGQAAASAGQAKGQSGQSEAVVTGGLLCVVIDPKTQKRVGHKWLQLECLTPDEYLDSKVEYKDETIGIDVAIKGANRDGRPEFVVDTPISLTWSDRVSTWLAPGYIPLQAKQKRFGLLSSQMPADQLSANSISGGRLDIVLPVAVDVDGYPRGLDYDVRTRDNEVGINRSRARTRVRITRVAMPGFQRVYYWPDSLDTWAAPKDDGSQKLRHIALSKGQPAILPAPTPTVLVDFQTDVPADMWTNPSDPRRRIEIGFRGQSPETFHGARQVTTRLLSTQPAIRLRMDVSDYQQVELDTGRPENAEATIEARIHLPGIPEHELDEREDDRAIRFDSDRPRIIDVALSATDPAAEQRTIRVQATDYSGIERVEFGFDQDGSGTPDTANDKLTTLSLKPTDVTSRELGQTHSFNLSVPVKDVLKDLQPGDSVEKLFFVRARDKVDHEGEFYQQWLRLEKPAEDAKPAPAREKTTVVVGQIRYGVDSTVNGSLFRATIEGSDIGVKQVAVDGNGGVRIEGLKPGQYTLSVKGFFNNNAVEASKPITIPASPKPVTNIGFVVVQRKRAAGQ